MARKKNIPWALNPKDLPSAEIVAREPRLAGLENNAVFRLMKWRARVAPVGFSMPSTMVGWLALVAPFMAQLPNLIVRNTGANGIYFVIFFMALFLVLFVVARYYKPKVSLRESTSSLFNIPSSCLYDLLLAGYPAAEIVAGIWGAGISSWRWGWPRIFVAAVAMIAVSVALSLISNWAMAIAIILFLAIPSGIYGFRGCEAEQALHQRVMRVARDRPDLKIKPSVDSVGCFAAIAICVSIPVLIVLILMLMNTAGPVKFVLTFVVYPIIAITIGYGCGLTGKGFRQQEFEKDYGYLTEYVRRIMEEIREAGELAR